MKLIQTIVVEHLLNKFRKDIEKQLGYLVNTAKRLKLTAPTWVFGDVYDFEFEIEVGGGHSPIDDAYEADFESFMEPVFDVTLNLEDTLKIDGEWIFACAIDHRAKAMIQIDETIEIPNHYSPSNDTCDHCGKKYPRVKSYIVFNKNTNEFKQVGKGCLKQFLGINPASYITMFEVISKFSPVIKGYGGKNRGGRLDNLAYNLNEMLQYTIHQVAKDGQFIKTIWEDRQVGEDWHGRPSYKKVIANPEVATINKVKERLHAISFFRVYPQLRNDKTTIADLQSLLKKYENRLSLFDGIAKRNEGNERAYMRMGEIQYSIGQTKHHIGAITHRDLLNEIVLPNTEEIANVRAFVEALQIPVLEEGQYPSGFDEYKKTLKTVFLKERTLQSNLNTIVSGYGFYLNQKIRDEKEKARIANAKNLSFVGVEGEKIELKLKITHLKTGQGEYGTWKLWSMEDEQGNKFKKFGEIPKKYTIVEAQPEENGSAAHIGSTIAVTVEVKKHDVYREEKQTTLGRMSKAKSKEVKYIYK